MIEKPYSCRTPADIEVRKKAVFSYVLECHEKPFPPRFLDFQFFKRLRSVQPSTPTSFCHLISPRQHEQLNPCMYSEDFINTLCSWWPPRFTSIQGMRISEKSLALRWNHMPKTVQCSSRLKISKNDVENILCCRRAFYFLKPWFELHDILTTKTLLN